MQGRDGQITAEFGRWLDEHVEAECLILCGEFGSRELRNRFARSLRPDQMERVHFQTLRHRRFGQDDWWLSEEGIAAFVGGWIQLILEKTRGASSPPDWRECEPNEYQPTRPPHRREFANSGAASGAAR